MKREWFDCFIEPQYAYEKWLMDQPPCYILTTLFKALTHFPFILRLGFLRIWIWMFSFLSLLEFYSWFYSRVIIKELSWSKIADISVWVETFLWHSIKFCYPVRYFSMRIALDSFANSRIFTNIRERDCMLQDFICFNFLFSQESSRLLLNMKFRVFLSLFLLFNLLKSA